MDPTTEMSPREVEAVQELKRRVSDVIPKFKREFEQHDLSLLRFLRARELNSNKAEAMLRSYAKWREENQVDDVQEAKVPIHFYEDFPAKICGLDKDGYLVIAAQVGKWDFRSAVDTGMKDEFIWFVIQWIERTTDICVQLTTEEKFYSAVSLILDLEGLQYRQLTSKAFISMVIELVTVFEANYPEFLRCIWVINAPTIFNMLWGIIKPFLTERTRSKIRIFGNNKSKWRPDILTMIEEDVLPSMYSGANTCCPNFDIDSGWDIKKLSLRYNNIFPPEEMLRMYIPAGDLFTLELHASYGTQIHWNFTTEVNDIVFRVDFDDKNIIESCRVDSSLCAQKGRISVENSGLYTLVFDNTYSSFKGKVLRYVVWTS